MDLNKFIGKEIRILRMEKKLSQENLAGLANIDRTYLQSIERGVRNISLNTLHKLTKALGVKMSKILENIDNEI